MRTRYLLLLCTALLFSCSRSYIDRATSTSLVLDKHPLVKAHIDNKTSAYYLDSTITSVQGPSGSMAVVLFAALQKSMSSNQCYAVLLRAQVTLMKIENVSYFLIKLPCYFKENSNVGIYNHYLGVQISLDEFNKCLLGIIPATSDYSNILTLHDQHDYLKRLLTPRCTGQNRAYGPHRPVHRVPDLPVSSVC